MAKKSLVTRDGLLLAKNWGKVSLVRELHVANQRGRFASSWLVLEPRCLVRWFRNDLFSEVRYGEQTMLL